MCRPGFDEWFDRHSLIAESADDGIAPRERTALIRFSEPGAVVGDDRTMFRKLLGRALVGCPVLSTPDDAPVIVTEYGQEALAGRREEE